MSRRLAHSFLAVLFAVSFLTPASAAEAVDEDFDHAVEQLRHIVGKWETVNENLDEDGDVVQTTKGTYEFEWVVQDRVLMGKTTIPDLNRAAGILYYVNESKNTIEMVSVGGDGMLWIMTGAAGEESRTTQEFETAAGGKAQMRFTRYNVTPDRFESKMEYSQDGGQTWWPGNHQVFERAAEQATGQTK